MQTYSHFLITAALNKTYKDKSPVEVDSRALLIGSFAPDVPLFILTIGFFLQRALSGDASNPELFGQAYDNLYFNNPVWIIGHSLLHSPLMVTFYLIIGYWFGIRGKQTWALSFFWFAVGCGFHTLIDIPTHHNDGPLLFFPFDWQTRFNSSISYWHPDYGGRIFFPIEHLANLGIIAYLVMPFIRRRFSKENTKSA